MLMGKKREKKHGPRRVQEGVCDPGPGFVPGLNPGDGARAGEAASAGLEPVRAWKAARIEIDTGAWRFFGVSVGAIGYGVESVARCAQGRAHRAPDAKCACGFYARRLRDTVGTNGGLVLLEVEMYGRIMEHQDGYRAEKQRVLAAYPSSLDFLTPTAMCHICAPLGNISTASSYVGAGNYYVAVPTAGGHTYHATITNQGQSTGPSGWTTWPIATSRPAQYETRAGQKLCAEHAVDSRHRFFELEAPDLVPLRAAVEHDLPTDWHWTT